MKKIHFLFCLFIIVVSFSSCNPSDDSNNSGPDDDQFSENFGSAASRDFMGQVIDIYNNPLQGVTIKIGTSTSQTDVNGVFIINDASVYQKFAYITAKKPGYIDGSRSMVPTMGTNNVKIMLVPNSPLATIQSGETSEVSLTSGTKVKFDGAFEDEAGNPYTGSVQVSMFHLTPSDENISELMPGMLYAQSETNQEVLLETYGMINVELRGNSGQKINIKEGHTAEIALPIDASQMATAPNVIPLWHFDEEKGYWKQDGIATKVGNKYVGEVTHFSWWNCDAPYPLVNLTVTVVDGNGNPISNTGVGLIANGNTYPVMGYTNTDGQVSGLIPANVPMVLNVYGSYYTCSANTIYYTSTIGPFSTNTILPTITINNTLNVLSTNVVGTLLKCNNTNVTNGYVTLKRNGYNSIAPVTNGSFSFNELYCTSSTSFTLKGFDIENLQQTDSINYNFVAPITTIGNLQACNSIDEFISYQIDNQPTIFVLENFSNNDIPGSEGFSVGGSGANAGIYIWGNTTLPGIYTSTQFSIEGTFGYIGPNTTNTLQFNLNQFGAIGEYIDMTFSGTYQDNTGNHTITGVVHVIRDN